ncbi:uncharacterized protein J8A68_003518 [[Candida] subhashii]|uniref:Uncharacterized protein n=1 Tax=[Candida] subhashii TaxID=561895 RepID=A0A8J5QIZ8_9ASCO|nr:uncharacterized protein J8A68_003518 [[Candida] subhashii]KAG7662968.1 hypothetical protein J8A68_003518 [[Candida] subhashii]
MSSISTRRLSIIGSRLEQQTRLLTPYIATQRRSAYNQPPQTPQQQQQEFEKQQYDQLMKEQFIRSTFQNGIPTTTAESMERNRMPFRTMAMLFLVSSSLSMVAYVVIQYIKFQDEEEEIGVHGNGQIHKIKRSRRIFLPLWINTQFFYTKKYGYPKGLSYFDQDYYNYILVEMDQLKNKTGNEDEVKNYFRILEEDNVKYTVLQKLSSNSKVKQIFGLPLSVDTIPESPDFKIWIETEFPSISGIQIDITSARNDGTNSRNTDIDVSWKIKPINTRSIANNALIQLGLKLDRLESSNAQIKTHEKSSGKVHEMKLENENLTLNKTRDYMIHFSGKLMIKDKHHLKSGILQYKGVIDFDHLMINRGVKICCMDLITDKEDNPKEKITYRIL